MVSDINNINSRQTGTTRRTDDAGTTRTSGTQAGASTPDASGDDVVVNLSHGDQLEAAANRLAAESAINESRVEQLRDQLRDGEFQVNPQSIAQKLLASDNDFE